MTPPLAPDEMVANGSERDVLETFLDLYRDIAVRKVSGLDASLAHRELLPSRTTLARLIAHLASVEREWFAGVLAGDPDPGTRADGGWGADESLDALVADYRAACAQSRAVAARFALEDTVPSERLGRVSLRWIYVHLIEETARHAGHADILRELTDGATGFDG
ncbi:hypothetical protein Val02_01200 [Virgisporangium aliadipatigenens]|uniref:Mini-circle protein n=1 Tax=Virgisporangium aliadipatigenens TaxID=741659 RepID=A0A8J3YDU3_9ACTN|nr:DinB family protein [Virgisporangium aliadipatigenens]GIJ43234.1 hypothetical protein Val02_01200 [Virgisporangium aliadipatigenens]